MRKAFAVAVAVAALTLTGCTGLGGTTPQDIPAEPYVAATTEPTDPGVTAPTPDTVFNTAINVNPELAGTEVAAKAMVLSLCKLADSSAFSTAYQMASADATAKGMSPFNFGYVIGAGVPLYCPNQVQAMDEYVRSAG